MKTIHGHYGDNINQPRLTFLELPYTRLVDEQGTNITLLVSLINCCFTPLGALLGNCGVAFKLVMSHSLGIYYCELYRLCNSLRQALHTTRHHA